MSTQPSNSRSEKSSTYVKARTQLLPKLSYKERRLTCSWSKSCWEFYLIFKIVGISRLSHFSFQYLPNPYCKYKMVAMLRALVWKNLMSYFVWSICHYTGNVYNTVKMPFGMTLLSIGLIITPQKRLLFATMYSLWRYLWKHPTN